MRGPPDSARPRIAHLQCLGRSPTKGLCRPYDDLVTAPGSHVGLTQEAGRPRGELGVRGGAVGISAVITRGGLGGSHHQGEALSEGGVAGEQSDHAWAAGRGGRRKSTGVA